MSISEKAKELLAKDGFDPNLGARPLKRVIQRLILDPLSIKIVTSEVVEGNRVLIDAKDGKIVFETPKMLPKMADKPKLAKSKK
jgi:ATP-dependent Clp protease ATP-binding subunit ClpA